MSTQNWGLSLKVDGITGGVPIDNHIHIYIDHIFKTISISIILYVRAFIANYNKPIFGRSICDAGSMCSHQNFIWNFSKKQSSLFDVKEGAIEI